MRKGFRDGSERGSQTNGMSRMNEVSSGCFVGVLAFAFTFSGVAHAKKKTVKVVEKTIEVDDEDEVPKPRTTGRPEPIVGIRGGGTFVSGGGGAGHIAVFGGAAFGGDHAIIITGQFGAVFVGNVSGALLGAAVGYRGYFTEGNVRVGATAVLEPEIWLPSGGTVFLVGPTFGPLVKVGPVSIGLPIALRFIGVSSRAYGASASGFALSPTLQVGFTF